MKNNFFFSAVSNFFKFFSGVVLVLVYARTLSPEQFGELSYVMTVAVVVGIIVDYGYNAYLPKESAGDLKMIESLVAKGIAIKLVLILLTMPALMLLYWMGAISGSLDQIITFCISAAFLALGNIFLFPYRSLDRFQVESKYMMIYNIMLSITVCVMALLVGDILWVGTTYLFCRMIFFWLAFNHFRQDFSFKLLSLASIWDWNLVIEAKRAWPYAIHGLIAILLTSVDTLILRHHVDSAQLGIYRAGVLFIVAENRR